MVGRRPSAGGALFTQGAARGRACGAGLGPGRSPPGTTCLPGRRPGPGVGAEGPGRGCGRDRAGGGQGGRCSERARLWVRAWTWVWVCQSHTYAHTHMLILKRNYVLNCTDG